MAVKIRVMEAADIEAADRMLCAAFGRTGFLSQIHLHRDFEPESIWAAEEAGRIVGSVSAVTFDRLAYIGLMAVQPEFQRRGIARRLMDHVLAVIDARRCPVTLLDATNEALRSMKVWGSSTTRQHTSTSENRARLSRLPRTISNQPASATWRRSSRSMRRFSAPIAANCCASCGDRELAAW